MALDVFGSVSKDPYLRYPELPPLPKEADAAFIEWYRNYQRMYKDFIRILQRDREEILAKINNLS